MQKYLVFLLCLGITLSAQADPTTDDFALQAGGIAGAVEACGQNITVYSGRVREAIIALNSNPADQMSAANLYGKSLTNAYARQKGLMQRMSCTDILTIYNGLPLMRSDYKQTVLPVLAANNPSHISTAPAATPTPTAASTTSSAATSPPPSTPATTPAAPVTIPTISPNNQAQVAANNAGAGQQQMPAADSSASDQLSPQQIAQQQLAQQQSMQNAMAYMQQQAQINAASPQMQQALADMTATPVQQQVTADSATPSTQQTTMGSSGANMVMANNSNVSNSEAADSPYYNERGGDNIAVSPSFSSGN